eukprot:GILK01019752.1.p1 GENE.GILK01019752.1~~GILK01019752.1.p1  ORF type:complete len:111 (+),score=12.92 GILK01019752.1:44-376(+)
MTRTKQTPRRHQPTPPIIQPTHQPIVKKTRRHFRPPLPDRSIALQEIRKLQKSTDLIPKPLFQRLVKEIATQINPEMRFQSQALLALHEAAEVLAKWDLARRIRGELMRS